MWLLGQKERGWMEGVQPDQTSISRGVWITLGEFGGRGSGVCLSSPSTRG